MDTKLSLNGLNILYLNIISLRNKLHDLETYIHTLSFIPDIIFLTEVRISKEESIYYNLPNYSSIFSTRQPNKKKKSGGGVGCFIHINHTYNIVSEISNDLDNYLLINLPDNNINLGLVYTPPDADKAVMIKNLESFFTNVPSIIIGDFNINLLDKSNETREYLDCVLANNFYILNEVSDYFPTRMSNNTNGTIIDHALTNIPHLKCIISYNDIELSDHKLLFLDCELPKYIPKKMSTPNSLVKIIDYIKILTYFQDNAFVIDDTLDMNSLFEHYIDYINTAINKCSSYKNSQPQNSKTFRKPWITKELIQLCKTKEKLFKLKKRNPNNQDIITEYKSCSNKVISLKKKLKKNYYKTIPTNNAKKFWNSINSIIYNKPKNDNFIPQTLINPSNNEIFNSPEQIAECFNDFLCNIGITLSSRISDTICQYNTELINNESSCFFYKTNETEILKIINELKADAVPGHDGITCKIIKYCKHFFSYNLAILINKSIHFGIFPKVLKIGKVTPIYKTGDKSDPSNYRPITVLPIISKIFEKVIQTRLNSFLNSINFISPAQYGFCAASSTEAACVNLLNDIQKGLDSKKNIQIGLLFIDLSKAFDTVPHNLLLQKITKLGIKSKEFLLFESYLRDRQQFVKCNNVFSSKQKIKCGVPQGAILSPTLFNIFINDITKLPLKGKIIIYADDICLKYQNTNPHIIVKEMEADLKILEEWFKSNKLSLNAKKTKFMIIGSRFVKNDNIVLPKLNDSPIERVNEYKYLGLIIDTELKWISHINYIKSKILPFIGILKRFKYTLPIQIKKQIYHSFIQSHLNYLNIIWGSAAKVHIKCLKVLQNYAIKSIFKLHYLESTTNIYKISNFPNFDSMRQINLIKFIYKLENGLIKSDLSLVLNSEIHNYATRISNAYRIDYARTNFGKFAILREAIHLYNTIPNEIKIITPFYKFKTNIKSYFLSIQNN